MVWKVKFYGDVPSSFVYLKEETYVYCSNKEVRSLTRMPDAYVSYVASRIKLQCTVLFPVRTKYVSVYVEQCSSSEVEAALFDFFIYFFERGRIRRTCDNRCCSSKEIRATPPFTFHIAVILLLLLHLSLVSHNSA